MSQNVEAIAEVIKAYLNAPESEGGSHYIDLSMDDRPGDGGGLDHLAKFLASRGVLVPSVLTDEECEQVAEDSQAADLLDTSTANYPAKVRAELERIAKGEV